MGKTPTPVPDAPVIAVSHLTKSFGARKANDDVGFSLPTGAFLSIFGPNGAGKTTLLRMLATLSRPTFGSIHLMGIDAREHPDAVRAHIGLVSHRSMLYPDLTAEENLLFACELYGVAEPARRVSALLRDVELTHRRHDRVRTFSRGMVQRMTIARALVHDPQLVFLDEPYSGLDPHAIEILDHLIDLVRADRSFVMVSHDLNKGFSLCSHVLLLDKGRMVAFEPREETDLDDFRARYLAIVGSEVL